MPIDSNRGQAVFSAVMEWDSASDRNAVLDRECSTDPELRRHVEALLWSLGQWAAAAWASSTAPGRSS
jgi:hypothetical protein